MGKGHKPYRDGKAPYKNVPRPRKAAKKCVHQSVKSSSQKSTQEKHNSNLRRYAVTQVQHMRAKLIDLMYRLSPLFSTRALHVFVPLIIGIPLLCVGCYFSSVNRIREVPSWSKLGPGILIASDEPLRGVEILVFTKDDGTTTLLFLEKEVEKILSAYLPHPSDVDGKETPPESDKNKEGNQKEQDKTTAITQDEYHLWIYLDSLEDAPINWTIPKQFGNVKNYKLSGNNYEYLASETNKNSGSDRMTAFKITYGAEHAGLVEINISEDPEHTAFRGNGIYKPRIPFISPWLGYIQSSEDDEIYADFAERSHYISDADMMRLSINNCQMYFPILKITTSYSSPYLVKQHDLEPTRISPEPEDGYPLICWTQYVCSFPTIQFRDKTWEPNAKRNNLLGGIFIGLGINVLLTWTNLYPTKKKR